MDPSDPSDLSPPYSSHTPVFLVDPSHPYHPSFLKDPSIPSNQSDPLHP